MTKDSFVSRVARDHYYLTVSNRIRATREAQGLSQRQLAERSGLSLSTVNNAENGQLSVLVLDLLATGLDVMFEELVPTEASSPLRRRA